MHTAIFHSVNSGLYFWDGQTGLLVDGIHQGREEGCSPMPEFLSAQLRRGAGLFAHLNGALFTHLHRDHFDPAGVDCLMRAQPGLSVYGPGLHGGVSVRQIRHGLGSIRMGGAYILARETVHDGACYRDAPHQSYLIRMSGESFFVAGDAALDAADAADLTNYHDAPITAGFFNLYQLASPGGQHFLRVLAPERVFLYHLPFPEDDRYHYFRLARQVLGAFPADMPRPERLSHMAWLDARAADRKTTWEGGEHHGLSGVAQR